MNITDKILDWITKEEREGRSVKQMTLSPWDEKELDQWISEQKYFVYEPTLSRRRIIYGVEIVSLK